MSARTPFEAGDVVGPTASSSRAHPFRYVVVRSADPATLHGYRIMRSGKLARSTTCIRWPVERVGRWGDELVLPEPARPIVVGDVVCSVIQRYARHRYLVSRVGSSMGVPVLRGRLLGATGRVLEPEVALKRGPYVVIYNTSTSTCNDGGPT